MLLSDPGRPAPATPSTRGVAVAGVVVLAVAIAVAGVRAPGTAGVTIAGVGTASPDESAPAPAAAAPAAPVALAPVEPMFADQRPETGDGATTSGALSVPDDPTGPAAVTSRPPLQVTTPVGTAVGDTPTERFESQFPAHAAAVQSTAEPATTHWALVIGVNEHQGRTRDNVGSRQDAEALYTHLIDLGWQPDHVLLLTDRLATRENIVEGIAWLADRTTPESTAVFHYAGHAKQWHGVDMDGDGEITDEGLWPSDNDHIVDGELVTMMAEVTAGRMWLNFMACEAAGFLDRGMVTDGRIATFSSGEPQKSYEDPSVGHSVWGWNLLANGMLGGLGDANGDGAVTVQEAAAYAIPRASERTAGQSHGSQDGGMVDRSGGPFSLAIDG